jgi:hypothetical protein
MAVRVGGLLLLCYLGLLVVMVAAATAIARRSTGALSAAGFAGLGGCCRSPPSPIR